MLMKLMQLNFCVCCVCFQAVEGVVLLPINQDFSLIGVKNNNLHFITAGSKGLPLELFIMFIFVFFCH